MIGRVAALVFALVGLTSCGDGPFELDLTIELGPSVDATTQAAITQLVLHTTGDETYEHTIPMTRAVNRQERLTYHPEPTSRELMVTIDAEDASGHVLASGDVTTTLTAGRRNAVTITLLAESLDAGMPDLGVHDATVVDATVVDATVVDVTLVDASRAPDLSVLPSDVIDFEGDAQDESDALYLYNSDCEIETSIVHSGKHAGYCHGLGGHWQLQKSFFPTSTPSIAFRAYVRFATTPGTDVNVFGFFDQATFDYVEVGNDYNGYYSLNVTATDGVPPSNVYAFADTSWHCVEAVMTHPSTASFYFDNRLIGTTTTARYPSVFSEFNLGIFKHSDDFDGGVPDVGVYMDDIAIGPERIGCD